MSELYFAYFFKECTNFLFFVVDDVLVNHAGAIKQHWLAIYEAPHIGFEHLGSMLLNFLVSTS